MAGIRIRPGRAADRPAVAAICAETWEVSDYVPEVWDEWLADDYGELAVAEIDGRVVGLAKLSRLGEGEWWLQGLRVHPDHKREGVATRLHAHLIERARESAKGQGTIRFATHSLNEPVHRIAANEGFEQVATYRVYAAPPLDTGDVDAPPPLTPASLEQAQALIRSSRLLGKTRRLYEVWWEWQELTEDRLAAHVADGLVWTVADEHGPAAMAIALPVDDQDVLHVAFVDGSDEALQGLLQGLRRLAHDRRSSGGVVLKALVEPRLTKALTAAGFEPAWDRDVWVFESMLD